MAEAQALILDVIEGQIGGAGTAAAGGLTGAYDSLGQSISEFWQALNDPTGAGGKFLAAASNIAAAIDRINQAISPNLFVPIDQRIAANSNELIALEDELQAEQDRLDRALGGGGDAATANPGLVARIAAKKELIDVLIAEALAQADAARAADLAAAAAKDQAEADRLNGLQLKEQERAAAQAAAAEKRRLGLIESTTTSLTEAANAARIEAEALKAGNVTIEEAATLREIYETQVRLGVDALSDEGKLIEEQIRQRRALSGEISDEIGNRNALTRATAKLREEEKDLNKDLENATKEAKRRADEYADVLVDGFADAINSGKEFQDVLKDIGRELLKLVQKQLILDPLSSAFSGFIQGATGNLFGGGGGSSLAPTTSPRPPLRPSFRALGGPVIPGNPYIVGEEGMELFIPQMSGTIIPNSDLGRAPGGGDIIVNQNNSINALGDQDIERVLSRRMPQVKELLLRAIRDERGVGVPV